MCLNFIPDGIRQELELEIGIGGGFIQFNSLNIISMFLVAPYLIVMQFRSDAGKANSVLTKLALALSLILVVLSGRRALWVVVALTPWVILFLSLLTKSSDLLKLRGKRVLFVCAGVSIVALSTLVILPEGTFNDESVTRFQAALSSDDERTIQKPHLFSAFLEYPILGSGFGGHADYTRDLKPWMYELTYYQMLFNLGLLGTTAVVALFLAYLVLVLRLLQQFKDGAAVPFALLIASCSLLAGAYSNPYLGGFDSLFFAGLLPFLSTFKGGFGPLPNHELLYSQSSQTVRPPQSWKGFAQ